MEITKSNGQPRYVAKANHYTHFLLIGAQPTITINQTLTFIFHEMMSTLYGWTKDLFGKCPRFHLHLGNLGDNSNVEEDIKIIPIVISTYMGLKELCYCQLGT